MVSQDSKGVKREEQLLTRIEELREEIRKQDPEILAHRTGATYQETGTDAGFFDFQVWKSRVHLTFPGLVAEYAHTGKPLGPGLTALVIYYFYKSNGTPAADEWISFTELPDGRFYTQAFQGYTGGELLREFGDDIEAFEMAAQQSGGARFELGDAAYSFLLLPLVPMAVVFWLGDEDFPSSIRILFDSSVSHQLPTDACAIAGSMLTQQLLSATKR